MLCDAHCHFFSDRFLELLTRGVAGFPAEGRAGGRGRAAQMGCTRQPRLPLADRWVAELDRHGVSRRR